MSVINSVTEFRFKQQLSTAVDQCLQPVFSVLYILSFTNYIHVVETTQWVEYSVTGSVFYLYCLDCARCSPFYLYCLHIATLVWFIGDSWLTRRAQRENVTTVKCSGDVSEFAVSYLVWRRCTSWDVCQQAARDHTESLCTEI